MLNIIKQITVQKTLGGKIAARRALPSLPLLVAGLGRGDRVIGPYDYVRRGKSFEKIGCSIGSAWIESGTAFDE